MFDLFCTCAWRELGKNLKILIELVDRQVMYSRTLSLGSVYPGMCVCMHTHAFARTEREKAAKW